MTPYNGRPPKWEPYDQNVYFDVPGGQSGRIRIPAQDEGSALAAFHAKWPAIVEVATDRAVRDDLVNGEVVLDIAMF
jgi:hypothetical protein